MALTLANEAGYFTSAQGIVSNEAADASAWPGRRPAPASTLLPSKPRCQLPTGDTGPGSGRRNAADGNDPATARAIATLERLVRTEAARPGRGTPTSTELLASLDPVTSDRRARLAAASRELPALYVITLVVSGVALIANASGLTIRAHDELLSSSAGSKS